MKVTTRTVASELSWFEEDDLDQELDVSSETRPAQSPARLTGVRGGPPCVPALRPRGRAPHGQAPPLLLSVCRAAPCKPHPGGNALDTRCFIHRPRTAVFELGRRPPRSTALIKLVPPWAGASTFCYSPRKPHAVPRVLSALG